MTTSKESPDNTGEEDNNIQEEIHKAPFEGSIMEKMGVPRHNNPITLKWINQYADDFRKYWEANEASLKEKYKVDSENVISETIAYLEDKCGTFELPKD